jgi:hypothetical protein
LQVICDDEVHLDETQFEPPTEILIERPNKPKPCPYKSTKIEPDVGKPTGLVLDIVLVSYDIISLMKDVSVSTEAVNLIAPPIPPEHLSVTEESEFQNKL